MSPEGELLGNLSKALKHILLSGSVCDEQMEILKDGLEYDGWSKETQLPDGWRVKRGNDQEVEAYLSPDLDFFSNRNEVSNYLMKSGFKVEANKFHSFSPKKLKTDIKIEHFNQTEWETDSSLPSGWKYCWTAVREKSKFKKHY